MSKYTTQVRFICESFAGLIESVGYDKVNEVIANSFEKIFDNDIPFFDDEYKSILFTKILRHYYDREIGFETVGLWRLKLNNKLHEIMPYYNKLYMSERIKLDPLNNMNVEKTSKNTFNGNKHYNGTENNKSNSSINNTHLDLFSDTPQGYIENLDNSGYVSEANKATDISSNDSTLDITRDNTDITTNIDDYLEKISGYSGVTGSELLLKYRETFINIDNMIIDELKDLFFLLW